MLILLGVLYSGWEFWSPEFGYESKGRTFESCRAHVPKRPQNTHNQRFNRTNESLSEGHPASRNTENEPNCPCSQKNRGQSHETIGSTAIIAAGVYVTYHYIRQRERSAPVAARRSVQGLPDATGDAPRLPRHYNEWILACEGLHRAAGSNFQYSGWTTESNHIGNMAYRAGKKIKWD